MNNLHHDEASKRESTRVGQGLQVEQNPPRRKVVSTRDPHSPSHVNDILQHAPSFIAIVAALALVMSVLFNLTYLIYITPRAIFLMTLSDYVSMTIVTIPLAAVPAVFLSALILPGFSAKLALSKRTQFLKNSYLWVMRMLCWAAPLMYLIIVAEKTGALRYVIAVPVTLVVVGIIIVQSEYFANISFKAKVNLSSILNFIVTVPISAGLGFGVADTADNPDSVSLLRLKSTSAVLEMRLLRAMDRGALLWDPKTKQAAFLTWDDIISITEKRHVEIEDGKTH